MEVSKIPGPQEQGIFATMADMWERRDHLPWRKTKDPYKILVSEMMLQQTQVERVIPFYNKFIKEFPTAKKLAGANLSSVLKAWQGLGYNRRAKYLHSSAKLLAKKSSGRPPASTRLFSPGDFASLPGVGPYTRGAVLAFAFNKPEVFVETNIRTVFFYHSNILQNTRMSDAELFPLVERALQKSKMQPRDFYAAMMDYGAHLKKQGIELNKKSKHYTKQSKFEGSTRQLRGAILRELLNAPATLSQLIKKFPESSGKIEVALRGLVRDGLAGRDGRHRYGI